MNIAFGYRSSKRVCGRTKLVNQIGCGMELFVAMKEQANLE